MKIKLFFFAFALLIASCAKLPTKSVNLIDAISAEGKRMHQINISLTNKLFNEKREKIDDFIKKDYTPKFIEEFTKKIPAGTDLTNELPNMMKSIIPKIMERRDAMQNALEVNRIKVIEKLDQDYKDYENACSELKKLLESAIKVNEESKKLLRKTQELTGSKIDFDQIGGQIDKFILNAGDLGENINGLNEGVNKILNK